MKNILILAITIFIFFAVLEIGARVASAAIPVLECTFFSSHDRYFTCQIEEKLARSMERFNQSTIRSDDICDKWDPVLGWRPKENCQTELYSTNSLGVRGDEEIPYRGTGANRIVIVGDSFTWGENNANDETYPYYLGDLLNEDYEVLNMGVHGYGPGQFYLYYNEEGKKYNPNILIYGLLVPDIHRTEWRVFDFFKPRFILENRDIVYDPNSKIPDFDEAFRRSRELKGSFRIYIFEYLKRMIDNSGSRLSSYAHEVELTVKIIEKLQNDLKGSDTELIVLLIPGQPMVELDNKEYYGAMPILIKGLDSAGIEYLDLQPAMIKNFEETGVSLYAGHMKPKGNKFIAEQIKEYLETR